MEGGGERQISFRFEVSGRFILLRHLDRPIGVIVIFYSTHGDFVRLPPKQVSHVTFFFKSVPSQLLSLSAGFGYCPDVVTFSQFIRRLLLVGISPCLQQSSRGKVCSSRHHNLVITLAILRSLTFQPLDTTEVNI